MALLPEMSEKSVPFCPGKTEFKIFFCLIADASFREVGSRRGSGGPFEFPSEITGGIGNDREESRLPTFTATPSSSTSSRARHCSGRSPSWIFPPGNSHFSGRLIEKLR